MKIATRETIEFHYTASAGKGDSINPTGQNDGFASTATNHYLDQNRLVLKSTSAMSVTIDCYTEHDVRTLSLEDLMPVATINLTEYELIKNDKTLLTLANDARNLSAYPDPFLALLYIFRFETTAIAYIENTEVFVTVQAYEASNLDVIALFEKIGAQTNAIQESVSEVVEANDAIRAFVD